MPDDFRQYGQFGPGRDSQGYPFRPGQYGDGGSRWYDSWPYAAMALGLSVMLWEAFRRR